MIKLELTPEEAHTLFLILNRVGGHPKLSLRGNADRIRQKLLLHMIDPESEEDYANEVSGSVQFEDNQ